MRLIKLRPTPPLHVAEAQRRFARIPGFNIDLLVEAARTTALIHTTLLGFQLFMTVRQTPMFMASPMASV